MRLSQPLVEELKIVCGLSNRKKFDEMLFGFGNRLSTVLLMIPGLDETMV